MSRKKVKLAFITNNSSRKTTYKKRKNGLLKKVRELSTLCDVTACGIIYSPYNTDPEVWPSNDGVRKVIDAFRTLPENDQQKNMVDQEAFLRQRIAKSTHNLMKQRKENREEEMTQIMFHCLKGEMGKFNFDINSLNDLGYVIDQFRKEVTHRLAIMQNPGMEIGESSNPAPAEVETVVEGTGTVTVAMAAPTQTTMVSDGGSSFSSPDFFNLIQQYQYNLDHQFNVHALAQAQQTHAQTHAYTQPQVQAQAQAYAQTQVQAQTLAQTQTQQLYNMSAPNVGFSEKHHDMNMGQNQNQVQQQWFMDGNHHQPHMLIPSDSSTPPASASANSTNDPNLTNNIWSR